MYIEVVAVSLLEDKYNGDEEAYIMDMYGYPKEYLENGYVSWEWFVEIYDYTDDEYGLDMPDIEKNERTVKSYSTMAIVNEYIEHKFYHFLNRWKSHFEETMMTNDIVNDFMWAEGYAGKEMFNELLSIIEANNGE